MSRPLVIIGCGGFGREVFALLFALNAHGAEWSVQGFVDDRPSTPDRDRVGVLGAEVIGTVAELSRRRSATAAVIAVGSPQARARIADRLAGCDVSFPVLIHPDATVGQLVELAEGVVVGPGARLSTNIRVGRHAQIDQNVTVGHDSTIADFARLNPQACVSGSVVVAERALVGAGAVVLPGLTVGQDAVVGAAACVVGDVPPASTVKGVPAR